MKNLRVLLLDDNKEVLDTLKANIKPVITVDDLSVRIEVEAVHVVLELRSGGQQYQVSEDTIKNLAKPCSQKFDYIFSDFTFVGDSNKNEQLRAERLDAGQPVTKNDLTGFVLQLEDVAKKFDEMNRRPGGSFDGENTEGKNIETNFINHAGKIRIYTNSPKPFDDYFGPSQMSLRRNEVFNVFKNASLEEFILMHIEFSITPIVDALFDNSAQRKTYYSSLLSEKIESLMHQAALESMVRAQSRLRFDNTKAAFRRLTAIGIGFGALVALFGESIFHSLHKTLSLTMTKLSWNVEEVFISLIVLVLLLLLSFALFPWLGVYLAKRTEAEVERL